jgi:IS5 family transposase
MRSSHRHQIPLTTPLHRHPRAQAFAALDQLLRANPKLAELVTRDLPHADGVSSDTGRPGMTGDEVLRAAVIRAAEGCTYADLAFLLADSQVYRSFCGYGWGRSAPSESTLQENVRRVRAETWSEVNNLLVGHAVELGLEPAKKTRIDCTTTDTNIHPPNDAAQLYDVVRVLVRLLRRARSHESGVVVHKRVKRAKRRWLETMNRSREKRVAPYRDLVRVAEEVIRWATAAIPLLRTGRIAGHPASSLADEIARIADLGARVVDQTRRRVFDGEKVPAAEKVVSIFEPHTDIIIKDRRETHFGHKLLLATGSSGLVQYMAVLKGNPADSTLVEQALDGVTQAIGKVPRAAALDGGFASKENLAMAKAKGVKEVCFSKRRGMAVAAMASSERIYRKLWRFRVGIEAGISWLKRCFGLRRCNWKGEGGFHAYVQSSVVAFNLLAMVRLTTV